jgi:YVTN family beta-propeller protein
MKKTILSISVILLIAITVSAQQTTSFSYQGKLNSSSTAANGTYDFRFELYNALSGGTPIGTVNSNGVNVTSGIFTVQLDFGAGAFDGTDRFLDISVKLPAEGTYTTLSPRQKIASVPYATKAIKAENADSLGGITANNYLQKNGDASQLTNINGASIINNTVNAAALASDSFPNQQNLSRLGTLRWDLLGQRISVGLFPIGIAFDGANIWTANATSSDVTKIRASDGTVLATIPVGTNPFGIAFDGSNMWVTNRTDNTGYKNACERWIYSRNVSGRFHFPARNCF